MNPDLLRQAAAIFDTPKKWQAFHDMQQACPKIVDHWLKVGAEALRKEFSKRSGSWKCGTWGNPRDTRWYLKDLGEKSISIGIGWETFELHLFDGRDDSETRDRADQLLDEPEFRSLTTRIGPRCRRRSWEAYKLLLADRRFDPFDTHTDDEFRVRLIAWHAGRSEHGGGGFVEKTLGWMDRLLEDPAFIHLVHELNDRSSLKVTEREPNSDDRSS